MLITIVSVVLMTTASLSTNTAGAPDAADGASVYAASYKIVPAGYKYKFDNGQCKSGGLVYETGQRYKVYKKIRKGRAIGKITKKTSVRVARIKGVVKQDGRTYRIGAYAKIKGKKYRIITLEFYEKYNCVLDLSKAKYCDVRSIEPGQQYTVLDSVAEYSGSFHGDLFITAAKSGRMVSSMQVGKKTVKLDETNEQLLEKLVGMRGTIFTDGMNTLQKVKAAHDYLCGVVSYDWPYFLREKQTGAHAPGLYTGALLDGFAVCSGYADAFDFIMEIQGIPCEVISSTAMNHDWNLVQIDGVWYNVDVTWDDRYREYYEEGRSYSDDIFPDGGIAYTYFLVSDQKMYDHPISKEERDLYPAASRSYIEDHPGTSSFVFDGYKPYYVENDTELADLIRRQHAEQGDGVGRGMRYRRYTFEFVYDASLYKTPFPMPMGMGTDLSAQATVIERALGTEYIGRITGVGGRSVGNADYGINIRWVDYMVSTEAFPTGIN
jgi:hypothetical protein